MNATEVSPFRSWYWRDRYSLVWEVDTQYARLCSEDPSNYYEVGDAIPIDDLVLRGPLKKYSPWNPSWRHRHG